MTLLLQPTLESLLSRIRRWLREPTASKSQWDDNDLKQFLNSSYRLRCSELHLAFEGFFVLVAQRDLVANQSRYSWPPNFQRLAKLELVRTDESRWPVQSYERHYEMLTSSTVSGDGYSPNYRPIGEGFELEPAPGTTITNGLRLEYWGLPAELENSNDQLNSDFPDLFSELLVLDAAASALISEVILEVGGNSRVIELERARYQEKWEKYIEQRLIRRSIVVPFIPHWIDA